MSRQLIFRRSAPLVRILVLAVIGGCASTRVTAFRDPDFAGKRYLHPAVFVLGTPLPVAQDMERRICASLAPTACSQGLDLMPPTRQYSAEDATSILARSSSDSVLIVVFGNDKTNSAVVGYQTFGTAQATGTATTTGTVNSYGSVGTYSGTTNATAQATGQSTTIPLMYFSRAAQGAVTLIDAASGKTAWTGQLQTDGRGLLNTSDDAFESSQCREIVAQLKAAGFVSK